jgi:hypothetical protein
MTSVFLVDMQLSPEEKNVFGPLAKGMKLGVSFEEGEQKIIPGDIILTEIKEPKIPENFKRNQVDTFLFLVSLEKVEFTEMDCEKRDACIMRTPNKWWGLSCRNCPQAKNKK